MPTTPRDPASAEVAPGLASAWPGAANCPLRALVLAVQEDLRAERRRARRRAYFLANRERILELQRKRRAEKRQDANAERRTEYARDPEKHRAAGRAYYYRNRSACLERRRATYAANREKQNAADRVRYAADREKRLETMRRYYRSRGKFLRAGVQVPGAST